MKAHLIEVMDRVTAVWTNRFRRRIGRTGMHWESSRQPVPDSRDREIETPGDATCSETFTPEAEGLRHGHGVVHVTAPRLMRQRGFEPPHPKGHGRLRTACLPFHHCRWKR